MNRKRLLSLLLALCLLLCGLSVTALAADRQITPGQTVAVDSMELYRFAPAESGNYVMYMFSGDADAVRIGVLDPDGTGYLSQGTRRCVLEAEAGQTYWFEMSCDSGTAEFCLEAAVPAETIALETTK